MKHDIYYTASNSDDNHQTKATVCYIEVPYSTLRQAKAALEGVACMLNEDCYKCNYKDRLTLTAERTDNKPQPTTDRVIYHIYVYHIYVYHK